MGIRILHKRSSTPNAIPLPSDILEGELAVNVPDGKVFVKKVDGDGEEIIEIGASARGYTGSRGEVGFVGSTGIGFTGSRGAAGIDGSIGYTGSRGDTGFVGSVGIPGATGASGDRGFTGSRGVGFTGSHGDTGFTGSIGYTGSRGDTGFVGSRGEIGYHGSRGNTGFAGSRGADGTNGSIGPRGYDGSRGFTGVTGARGETGYTGSRGELGFTGSRGSGFTGSRGNDGESGTQGPIGYTGSQGSTGIQGPIGYTGSNGYTGSRGATGLEGGDPWNTYGTPDWRYEFTDLTSLDDWNSEGSPKADVNFRNGMYFPSAGGEIYLTRVIPNAPFIFDIRITYSRPSIGNQSFHGMFLTGDGGAGRQVRWGIQQLTANAYATYSSYALRLTTFGSPAVVFSQPITPHVQTFGNNGITLRCWYDGTNYRFFHGYGDPAYTDQEGTTMVYAKSSWLNNPLTIGIYLSNTGPSTRVKFAQFQSTNLDQWAGM